MELVEFAVSNLFVDILSVAFILPLSITTLLLLLDTLRLHPISAVSYVTGFVKI